MVFLRIPRFPRIYFLEKRTAVRTEKEPPPNSVPITLRWAAAHDRPDKVSASM
jgi:hypothetical protein